MVKATQLQLLGFYLFIYLFLPTCGNFTPFVTLFERNNKISLHDTVCIVSTCIVTAINHYLCMLIVKLTRTPVDIGKYPRIVPHHLDKGTDSPTRSLSEEEVTL